MTFSPSTIYLITGSNRGLGFGFVTHILKTHLDAFVYAGTRDPSKASDLKGLESRYPDRIATVKCVSGDEEGNKAMAKEIEVKHGRLDTVIANAAVARITTTVLDTPAHDFEEHLQVNVVGTVVLFQSVHHLLKASSTPKLVTISTAGGSIGTPGMAMPLGIGAYGCSKAALNYITRKIHFENEWLITFPLNPGIVLTEALEIAVKTDVGGLFAQLMADPNVPSKTPKEAAAKIITLVDGSTREKQGGQFIDVDEKKIPW